MSIPSFRPLPNVTYHLLVAALALGGAGAVHADFAPERVGAVPGGFHVNHSGAAVYTIPVQVPDGRAGMQPNLALVYSSQAGDSFIGEGFRLAGLGSVTRCGTTLADDGKLDPLSFDVNDPLCLDGRRLVLVSGVYGEGQSEYRTLHNTHARVTATGVSGAGATGFVVEAKDGTTLRFDEVIDTPRGIRAWLLSRHEDQHGNRIEVRYSDFYGDGSEVLPYRISYGATANGAFQHSRGVEFTYSEGQRPDAKTHFSAGVRLRSTKLLERIRTFAPNEAGQDEEVLNYILSYDTAPTASRVEAIVVCSERGVQCRQSTRFEWTQSLVEGFHAGGNLAQMQLPYINDTDYWSDNWPLPIDENGDGYIDLIMVESVQPGAPSFVLRRHDKVSNINVIDNFSNDIVLDVHDSSGQEYRPLGQDDTPSCDPAVYLDNPDNAVNNIDIYGDLRTGMRVIDFNGDALPDIFFYRLKTYDPATSQGAELQNYHVGINQGLGEFLVEDTGIAQVCDASDNRLPIAFADINGDGLDDILRCSGAQWSYRLNTQDGRFATEPQLAMNANVSGRTCNNLEAHFFDVDGDGDDDLLTKGGAQSSTTSCPGEHAVFDPQVSGAANHDDRTCVSFSQGGPLTEMSERTLDLNGDGQMDVLAFDSGAASGNWVVALGTGASDASSFQQTILTNLPSTWPQPSQFKASRILDWDGDGRADLLVPLDAALLDPAQIQSGPSYWRGFFSRPRPHGAFTFEDKGNAVPLRATTNDNRPIAAILQYSPLLILDVNEDGRQDALYGLYSYSSRLSTISRWWSSISDTGFTNKIVEIRDGFADDTVPPTTKFDYATMAGTRTLSEVYEPATDCEYPQMCAISSHAIVARTQTGGDDPELNAYRYHDGRSDRLGRGWLGFAAVEVFSGTFENYTNTKTWRLVRFDNKTYLRDLKVYPFAHLPIGEILDYEEPHESRITSHDVTREFAIRQRTDGSAETYFAYVQSEESRTYEFESSTTIKAWSTAEFTVDEYGQRTKTEAWRREAPSWSKPALPTFVLNLSYDNNEQDWCLGELRDVETTAREGTQSAQRTEAFDYARCGQLSIQVVAPGNSDREVTVDFLYDNYGNNIEQTEFAQGVGARTTSVSYDALENIYPVSVVNPLLHSTGIATDRRFGVTTSVTDANGLTTSWAYDDLGRETSMTRPDGTSTQIERANELKDGTYRFAVREWAAGMADVKTTLDNLGRPVLRRWAGFGGTISEQAIEFDGLDRPIRWSRPYEAGTAAPHIKWFERSYDALGRTIDAVEPDGTSTMTSYAGLWSTHIDARNIAWQTRVDGAGRVVETVDPKNGRTLFEYGPFSTMTRSTDAEGNATSIAYDEYGYRERVTDPDTGTTVYDFNAFSELTSRQDARGEKISYTYDALGRMTSALDDMGTSTWVYDNATNGVGQMVEARRAERSGFYSRDRYRFDTYGRPNNVNYFMQRAGGRGAPSFEFSSSRTYDSFGRVKRLDYPSRTASGAGTFAVDYDYDYFGHLRRVKWREGSRHRMWEAQSRDVEGRLTEETFPNHLSTERWYDPANGRQTRIKTRCGSSTCQDVGMSYDGNGNVVGVTDSVNSNGNRLYAYDEVNRLTVLMDRGRKVLDRYAYDKVGNIKEKGGASYSYNALQPHAVTRAGADEFRYDVAGNQTSRPNETIYYTPRNKPYLIAYRGNQPSRTIRQDASNQRRLVADDKMTRIYLGGLLEYEVRRNEVTERWKVFADGRQIAERERTSQPRRRPVETTRYLHDDHLGSPTLVSNESGNVVEQKSYDPFGAVTGSTTATNTGYTGHEAEDDGSALVHMGGRIYDPAIGRFLSADPVVQLPTFSQSHNRYSYVFNNPVSRVDPSGYQSEPVTGGDSVEEFPLNNGKTQRVTGGIALGSEENFDSFEEALRDFDDASPSPSVSDAGTATDRTVFDDIYDFAAGATAQVFRLAIERSAKALAMYSPGLKMGWDFVGYGDFYYAAFGASLPTALNQMEGSTIVDRVNLVGQIGVSALASTDAFGKGDYGTAGARAVNAVDSAAKIVEIVVTGALASGASAASAAGKTGTVWGAIKATQPNRAGTMIPRSFEIGVDAARFWVHPNATKHMAEYVLRFGVTNSKPIASQAVLTSFRSAVNTAARRGIQNGDVMQVGRWNIRLGDGAAGDVLPVIKHALYK